MSRAFVGLGSNLGDRGAHLAAAIGALGRAAGVSVRRVSSIRETDPVGGPDQDPFLNAAVEIWTTLEPADLLETLKRIERDVGRTPGERWGPREIDLDLLLHDDRVVRGDGLEVPHPRLAERGFVLEPLAEIAPDALHPGLGRTVQQLWETWRQGRPEDDRCE